MNERQENLVRRFSVACLLVMVPLATVVAAMVHHEMGHLVTLIEEHARGMRSGPIDPRAPYAIGRIKVHTQHVEGLAYVSLGIVFAILYLGLVGVVRRGWRTIQGQEKRFRLLVEGLGEGLMVTDDSDRIVYANTRLSSLFGQPVETIVGRDWRAFLSANWGGSARQIEVPVAGRDGQVSSFETAVRRGDGAQRRVQIHVTPYRWWAENADGRLCALTDITEQWRAQQAAENAHSELRRQYAELEMTRKQLQQANEQLQHDAFHDALTGLPNRALFMDRLSRVVERNKRHTHLPFGLLFIDIDRFKAVNDSMGHIAGDRLLASIGRRLKGCVRETDTVARLGGDEFTVLLDHVEAAGEAARIAGRIQTALADPVKIDDSREISVSASIGVVEGLLGFESAQTVLRAADVAMYRAKSGREGGYRVFDHAMHHEATRLLALEADITGAQERGEMHVRYQPIVALADQSLVGFEALLRWTHPKYGPVSPADFIPIAEETRDIIALDRWVLRQACAQLVRWDREYPANRRLSLSVNVSGRQFSRTDLVHCVQDTLLATELDPSRLKLEVTETTLLRSSDVVEGTLRQLRDLGVELSIDDFGTGYSSLQYIQSFPANVLKIDRCFVERVAGSEQSRELVQTMIAMAQHLGMQVIAEGVETADQLAALRNLRCLYGQGFLFSKPLAAGDVLRYLDDLRYGTGDLPVDASPKGLSA